MQNQKKSRKGNQKKKKTSKRNTSNYTASILGHGLDLLGMGMGMGVGWAQKMSERQKW